MARSRVTNGKDILSNVDGRSLIARRYRDIVEAITSDQGGVGRITETRAQLIRRFASLSVQAEAMDAQLANGKPINISEYSQISSTLVRIAQRLGINRVARDITPSPLDFARRFDQQKESAT